MSILSWNNLSDGIIRRRYIVQNFRLVWLDVTNEKRNSIDLFKDIDQCIDYITDVKDEKIFLIISGCLMEQNLRILYEISQSNFIYIFTENSSQSIYRTKDWPKIKGKFTEIDHLYESLKQATHQHDQNSISMSFVPKSANPVGNLDELDQTLWVVLS